MKITEYRGDDALDLFVDILDPVSNIISDKTFELLIKTCKDRKKIIKYVLKQHKKDIMQIMARLDNEEYEEYVKKVNIFTFPKKLMELFEDRELLDFFASQGLMMGNEFSGSVTGNTEETEIM